MYTVSKGPNKIVAKTRRGLAPNYEKFETIRDISKKGSDVSRAEDFNVPRPVFQTNKRSLSYSKNQLDDEALTPQHEEIVKYITESWNMVVAQNPYDSPASPVRNSADSPSNSSLYCVEPPSPVLTDFKPFDLESWWGRRLFNNITKSL